MLHLSIPEALELLGDPEISRIVMIKGVSEHLHQDLLEGICLATTEALALVEASIVGLKIPQCNGEHATQGIIRDGCAPIPPLQKGQQPRAVGTDHSLTCALLIIQLAAPGFASPQVLQGVVGAGDLQGLACGALEHCGVVGLGQLCDRKKDEQPDPLHVTLPLWRAATGYFVQDLVFP